MFVLLKSCGLVSAHAVDESGQPSSNVVVPPSRRAPKVITNTIGMKLVLVPAGEFVMGSSEGEGRLSEHPRHRVRITRPFYLGETEVTRGQFRRFVEETIYRTESERSGERGLGWNEEKMSTEVDSKYTWRNLGFEQTDEHPVGLISWDDAVAFCQWLSKNEGAEHRLPTEAEWEYACRAGTSTRFFSGDDPESLVSVANVADGTAREKKASHPKATPIAAFDGFGFTAPVGRFQPNAFGLYDMHGNMAEWCYDLYDAEYYRYSPNQDPPGPPQARLLESEIIGLGLSPKRSPPGPASIPYRVVRGGDWSGDPRCASSTFRVGVPPNHRNLMYNGFRVARVAGE
jgi:formylglycine-generating enzyme required for sulfatase activity